MRLDPIEKPDSWMMRVGYWMALRELGKVPSVFKVFYARVPRIARLGFHAVRTLEKGLSLEPELKQLVMTQASMLNGCGFCADLERAMAVRAQLGTEKFDALADYRTSPVFSDRERAALACGEEATRTRKLGDETFGELQKHFDDRQIAEIIWVNALANYFNSIAGPLGLESDGLTELAVRARAA